MINLSTDPGFASKFLVFKNFKVFWDLLYRTQCMPVLKFIENCLYFSKNHKIKNQFKNHSIELTQILETTAKSEFQKISSIITILSEIYALRERKAISVMMKILKNPKAHPNIYISSFEFLTKALYSPNLQPGLINKSVLDYVMKKYFNSPMFFEEEIKFQFLFFICNLMIVKNYPIQFDMFLQKIEVFDQRNLRFLALVMNMMDTFICQAIRNNQPTEQIKHKKFEFYQETVSLIDNTMNTTKNEEQEFSLSYDE